MLNNYIDLTKLNTVNKINETLRQGNSLTVFGVNFEGKCHVVSLINEPVLFVLKDVFSAKKAYEILTKMTSKKVVYIPEKDDLLTFADGFLKEAVIKRTKAVKEIQNGANIVVASITAILQYLPKSVETLILKKGGIYDREYIVKKLLNLGYQREETISGSGEFCVRGDVIDIADALTEKIIRLDFFDTELEQIKLFERESKKSIGYSEIIEIEGVIDYKIEDDEKGLFIEKMNKEVLKAPATKRQDFEDLMYDWLNAVESQNNVKCQFIMPYLKSVTNNVYEIFNGVTVFDELDDIYEISKLTEKEFLYRQEAFYNECKTFSFTKDLLCSVDDFIDNAKKTKTATLCTIKSQNKFINNTLEIDLKINNAPYYSNNINEFLIDLKGYIKNKNQIIVCAENEVNAEDFALQLERLKVPYKIYKSAEVNFDFLGVKIILESIDKGFYSKKDGLVVHDLKEIMIKKGVITRKTKKEEAFFIAPEVGDYVVHEVHGIGKVLGNRRLSAYDGDKDFISVEYLNGTLYIPVENFNVLTKYVGGVDAPKLSKLGGTMFEKAKQRVIESLKEMSIDLRALYKERNSKVGYKFESDPLEDIFKSYFKYTDTPDQATASNEINIDMQSNKVMDRLICGDVGFGKTEIAFRAIFKCILNKKQAVLLAPTTILTEQHYQTALKRFKDFGVNVEVLNRFKSKKEQERIIADLKLGKIDLIIGTHRLLGKDVKFYDLGLLVLDEEQRFGVEHKEKIKLLKTNVDTLTLSATPIPRTLNMSLSGLRDISVIATPPEGRLPVQTYVVEEDDAVIKDAIIRELARGGQVFILYNRVETISTFASRVQSLVKSAKVSVAHGQMQTKELENCIKNFYEHKTNVLVATTLIENGVDIPKANTLIVIDADRLGLSSLYQLKGRVGRSTHLARAFFTYKKAKQLTSVARERLSTLIDFAEMGSGVKVAMRDLQIRGAGNVLGKQQHGHIAQVGYELYTKLLKEVVENKPTNDIKTEVNISAILPDYYVQKNSQKMEIYKEIADAKNSEELNKIKERLESYYGILPKETQNLFDIVLLKLKCKKVNATEIYLQEKRAYIAFLDVEALSSEPIRKGLELLGKEVYISFNDQVKVEFKTENSLAKEVFLKMQTFLQEVKV